MLNDGQRNQVWEEWLAAEMRAYYFGDLCGSYQRRHRIVTWSTLFLSCGAAAAILYKFQPQPSSWAALGVALVIAGMSLYTVVAQNIVRANACSDLHFRWNKLAIEYHDIWNNRHARDAASRLARVTEQSAEVSKAGTGNGLPNDKRRMMKWYDLVVEQRLPHQA